jgi:hemerythrin
MKLLAWANKYSVQIAECDAEHQIWFDMVNRLHQAMLVGKGRELLLTLADDLMQHTLEHFAHEESLMKTFAYPGHSAHLHEHNKLRLMAEGFMLRFVDGENTMTIELLKCLLEMVPLHISTFDRQFVQYLSAPGSVGAPRLIIVPR